MFDDLFKSPMHLIRRHHQGITREPGDGVKASTNLFESLESRLLMSANSLVGDVNSDQFIARFDSELKVQSYMPGTHIGKIGRASCRERV